MELTFYIHSYLAPPLNLTIERQVVDSAVVRWQAADLPLDKVIGYAIYVNGALSLEISKNEKTKALVGGLHASPVFVWNNVLEKYVLLLSRY